MTIAMAQFLGAPTEQQVLISVKESPKAPDGIRAQMSPTSLNSMLKSHQRSLYYISLRRAQELLSGFSKTCMRTCWRSSLASFRRSKPWSWIFRTTMEVFEGVGFLRCGYLTYFRISRKEVSTETNLHGIEYVPKGSSFFQSVGQSQDDSMLANSRLTRSCGLPNTMSGVAKPCCSTA